MRLPFLLAALLLTTPAWGQALPIRDPGGPDAAAYGQAEGYPNRRPGTPREQSQMVGEFSHADALAPFNRIPRAAQPSQFTRAPTPLRLSWTYQANTTDLPGYLDRHPTTGLLILKGRTILYEHYRYARSENDRFLSQSMAKTITAMLVGLAVADGKIRSIDDPAQAYAPLLADTALGATTLSALLTMSSGLAYRETYDGTDDAANLNRALFARSSPGAARVVRRFEARAAPPGTKFLYKGVDTQTLGVVLAAATGRTQAETLASRIWQPMGAEADATWITDIHGQEAAFCCFSATLRDWGRLGALLAADGAWDGQPLIPAAWVRAATSVQAPHLAPGPTGTGGYYGYGYQVWLLPGARRQFVLLGIHGQALYVDPASRLVLVHTAVRLSPNRDPMAAELGALWRALVAREGN